MNIFLLKTSNEKREISHEADLILGSQYIITNIDEDAEYWAHSWMVGHRVLVILLELDINELEIYGLCNLEYGENSYINVNLMRDYNIRLREV